MSLYWTGTGWHGKPRRKAAPHTVETALAQARDADAARREAVKLDELTRAMPVTTALELPGFRIVRHCGEVFGLTVRSRNFVSDFGARVASAFGGEIGGYTTMLRDARAESLLRLRQEAAQAGGNAVIAMALAATQIADMTELLAYGTACVVEPLESLRAPARALALHAPAARQRRPGLTDRAPEVEPL